MILRIESPVQTERQKKSIGLTMVELMITMMIMSLIMGGLVTAFIVHSRIYAAEEARIDVQQNLRVAIDILKNTLRQAGFGCYDSFADMETMSGSGSQGTNIEISSFISHAGTESMIFTYGFRKIGEVNFSDSEQDNFKIKLKNIRSPSISTGSEFKRYLTLFPSIAGNRFFKVREESGNVLTFYDDDFFKIINLEVEPDVYMVSPTRVMVSYSGEIPVLYLKNFAYTSSQFWIVAENIKNIWFQYYVDGIWMNEVNDTDLLQKVRKIRFWVLATSINSVSGAGEYSFEIKDPDTEEIIYQVGPFNDGHIYMLSQGEVGLRNAD